MSDVERLESIANGTARPDRERVARLVSGQFVVDATLLDHVVASKVRKLGARMERAGYLPALRREQMRRLMMREIGE